MLREWRAARGLSQLALSIEAGVSARHLSFIETGRATPSREMVLSLAEHLEVPLRDRNALLEAAGFAAVYRETPLDAASMSDVREALRHMLEASEPNPTFVVNRRYDILMANDAAVRFLSYFAPAWRGKNNVALVLAAPTGLRPAIVNWDHVARYVFHHMRAELQALHERSAADEEMLAHALAIETELPKAPVRARGPEVLVPVQIRHGEVALELFTTITTLGTPLDITLQELRIETLFAANAASRQALAELPDEDAD